MQPYRLQDIKAKPRFAQAAEVLEEMVLAPLIEMQCPYNVLLILQFFSTLVIEGDIPRTMKWMSGHTQHTSSFARLGSPLGYTFHGEPDLGRRMHTVEKPNKNVMRDMYGADGVIGKKEGLLPLYDQLVTILQSTLAPSGGNNDNIVAPLGSLLCLVKYIVENEEENMNLELDMMDYIFNEMHESMASRLTIPYAPYIILLIQDSLRNHNFKTYTMQPHTYKKVYDKKKSMVTKPSRVAAPARGSFMEMHAVVLLDSQLFPPLHLRSRNSTGSRGTYFV